MMFVEQGFEFFVDGNGHEGIIREKGCRGNDEGRRMKERLEK
jgi:hypothetical protein